jgi:hypothetical protein
VLFHYIVINNMCYLLLSYYCASYKGIDPRSAGSYASLREQTSGDFSRYRMHMRFPVKNTLSCPRFPLCGRSRRAEQESLILGLGRLHIGLTFGLKKLAYGVGVRDAGRARPAKHFNHKNTQDLGLGCHILLFFSLFY